MACRDNWIQNLCRFFQKWCRFWTLKYYNYSWHPRIIMYKNYAILNFFIFLHFYKIHLSPHLALKEGGRFNHLKSSFLKLFFPKIIFSRDVIIWNSFIFFDKITNLEKKSKSKHDFKLLYLLHSSPNEWKMNFKGICFLKSWVKVWIQNLCQFYLA
jgi:hypothetical protein